MWIQRWVREEAEGENTVISESLCISKLPFTGIRGAFYYVQPAPYGGPTYYRSLPNYLWHRAKRHQSLRLATLLLSVFPNCIWRIVHLRKTLYRWKPNHDPDSFLSCRGDTEVKHFNSTGRLLLSLIEKQEMLTSPAALQMFKKRKRKSCLPMKFHIQQVGISLYNRSDQANVNRYVVFPRPNASAACLATPKVNISPSCSHKSWHQLTLQSFNLKHDRRSGDVTIVYRP